MGVSVCVCFGPLTARPVMQIPIEFCVAYGCFELSFLHNTTGMRYHHEVLGVIPTFDRS
jgi:hypothetical protein